MRKLAAETPATYVLFDLLVDGSSALYERPLRARRERLETLRRATTSPATKRVRLSPATDDPALAQQLARRKPRAPRRRHRQARRARTPSARRDAVVKVKRSYTADCVVGGFRASKDGSIASLLLGLYDDDGLLHHVGFVGSMGAPERKRAGDLLRPIVEPPGFTGNAPGGPSRWRREQDAPWFPVRPEIVVEVAFDHVTARRFRHATRLLRWRADKAPRQCTMEQLSSS